MGRARGRLEPARAPAAVHIEAGHRGLADDGAAVRRHVHDPAPVAQHPHPAELGEQLADGLERVLGDVQPAPLGIARIDVGAGADHQLALVGLADIGVDGVAHHHAGEDRLHRLRHQGLQGEALQRQADPGHAQHHAGVPRRGHADLGGLDAAAGGLHRLHRALGVADDAGDFAVLEDVHPQPVGGAGIAPGHGVVPGGAAPPLERGTQHRIAHVVGDVQGRAVGLRLLRRQPLIVHARGPVGVDVALEHLHVVHRVGQHHHAPLAEHDVVVQLPGQALPQLDGVVVEPRALRKQVVGADDGGVAPGIAAPQPALLDHGDVAHPVLAGQVVGRAQAVPAATDDHRVIGRLRLGRAPLRLPARLAGQALPEQLER